MKTFWIAVVLLVGLSEAASAQTYYTHTFTGKTFAKATSRTDTSANVTVGAYPAISLTTTTAGTDSANIHSYIDVQMNGVWWNDAADTVVTLGRPAAWTLAGSAHTGQVYNFYLRDNGQMIDKLGNGSVIRVRNVITAGAGDSTAATSYTQSVALRKLGR